MNTTPDSNDVDVTVPEPLDAERVGELVSAIRSSFESAWEHYANGCALLVEAYQGRAWEPLGLPDWGAFVSHTLDVEHLKIPRAQRREIVQVLREGGLTVRAIAAATGMSVGTVANAMPGLADERSILNIEEAEEAEPELFSIPATLDAAGEELEERWRIVNQCRWTNAAIVWSITQHQRPVGQLVAVWNTGRKSWMTDEQAAIEIEEYRQAWQWAMSEGKAPDLKPGDQIPDVDLDWFDRPYRVFEP